MIRSPRSLRPFALLPVVLVLLLSACSSSTSGPSTGVTPGATATHGAGVTPTTASAPCATRPTATAETWISGQQVMGSIPASGAPATLSAFVYPLGIPDEGAVGNAPFPSFTAIAPDARHLAVAILQDAPNFTEYDPYVVDTSTHAVTRVPLPSQISGPSEDIPRRLFAWADTHTLIIFANTTYSYDVTTNAVTSLPGITNAWEGVVRCSTLFYLSFGAFTPLVPSGDPNHNTVAPTLITRYDLGSHAAVGSAVTIGQASTFGGAEGKVDYGGWDATPDGGRIAYQHEALTFSGGQAHTSSHWFAANADGSGAVAILPSATASNGARMSISPDGTQVAVTDANPAPNVLSGPLSGGPTHFYDSPDGATQPAWRSDGSAFLSGTPELAGTNTATAYPIGSAIHSVGATAHASAHDPATLGG